MSVLSPLAEGSGGRNGERLARAKYLVKYIDSRLGLSRRVLPCAIQVIQFVSIMPSSGMQISENLRSARLQLGLKQYVVAGRAGITKAMLSAYECGKQEPSTQTFLRLAKALEVAPAGLLGESLPDPLPRRTGNYPLRLVGQNLRAIRDQRGMKQWMVAERAGITKGMLSAYETGRQEPHLSTLFRLSKALEAPPVDLFKEGFVAEPTCFDDELDRRLRRIATLEPAARDQVLGLLDEYLALIETSRR